MEPFARGTYAEPLEELAFSLEPGQTGTVTTQRGIFIIHKIAQLEASKIPFEQVREELREEIWREKAEVARDRFIEDLRERYETRQNRGGEATPAQ